MGYYSPSKVRTRVVKYFWYENMWKIQYRVGFFGLWKSLKAHPLQFSGLPSRVNDNQVSTVFFLNREDAQLIANAFNDEGDIHYHYQQIQSYEKKKHLAGSGARTGIPGVIIPAANVA